MTNLRPLVNPEVAKKIENNTPSGEEGSIIINAANKLRTEEVFSLLNGFREDAREVLETSENPEANEIALDEFVTTIVSTTRGLFADLENTQKIQALKLKLAPIQVSANIFKNNDDDTTQINLVKARRES